MPEVERLFDALELRRAIRVLKDFVADERAEPTAEVTDALDVYSAACRQVNNRLGECARLLPRGQRSEALRQVQMDPDALAMFDDLQFKNASWLVDVCRDYKLPAPPRLDATAAAKLNEAYATEQQHRDILRQHRLLALTRAPLRRRLEVVRLIRKAAPNELFWQDDIAAYEVKRVEQIRATMGDPKLRDDWPTVRELYLEMTAADGWREPFPLDLSEQIRNARNRLLGKAAGSELKPVRDQLERHLTAFRVALDALDAPRSFAAGREAAEELDHAQSEVERVVSDAEEVGNKYELAADGSLLAAFEQAADDLDEARGTRTRWREFEKVVTALEDGLDHGHDWGHVRQCYQVAAGFRWPIPKRLLKQYEDKAAARRRVLLIATVIVLGLAVAVVVLLVVLFVKF